jgi:hypothetical protein
VIRTRQLTKDLDQVVRCLTEVGGIDTLLGDLDIGIRLTVLAVSEAFERSVPSRHIGRPEHTFVIVSKNCGSDIVLFVWY